MAVLVLTIEVYFLLFVVGKRSMNCRNVFPLHYEIFITHVIGNQRRFYRFVLLVIIPRLYNWVCDMYGS